MLIGNKWKIEADPMNIILYKKITRRPKNKPPHDDWKVMGYHSNVKDALHDIVEIGIKESQLTDLRTVEAKIKELHDLVNTLHPL